MQKSLKGEVRKALLNRDRTLDALRDKFKLKRERDMY